jgi:hypothetical protein
MHFYSGAPMHFVSGVDSRKACGEKRQTVHKEVSTEYWNQS